MNVLKSIWTIAVRECGILRSNPVYLFCMVIFPVLVVLFFTSLMNEGQPVEMPVGIVDLDNTPTTRSLVRKLDGFQTTHVVGRYPNLNEARNAIQRNQIYAFLYIPKGTTDGLLAARQPKISFYYTNTSLTAGALLYRDLKTIATLGSAAVGQGTLRAKGLTDEQIQTFLQPISVDLHPINNPWINYNVYLSTVLIPGVLMLFMLLLTAYSLGTELKFNRSEEWLNMAGGNIHIAVLGKLLPQTLVFLLVQFAYLYYMFGFLQFPHAGGIVPMVLLSVLAVAASQGFGLFMFGLLPSLRMSMSVCSLWGVLSFSMAGSAFPVMGMDTPLEALAQLFPLRHYYMLYQIAVFNGYPLLDAWFSMAGLMLFALLPALVMRNLKRAMLTYVYIP